MTVEEVAPRPELHWMPEGKAHDVRALANNNKLIKEPVRWEETSGCGVLVYFMSSAPMA